MRPKERRDSGQKDLFRARLDQIIDMNHPLAKLARNAAVSHDTLLDELYLMTVCRLPQEKERGILRKHLLDNAADRFGAAQDILWALLNSREFLFNH